MAEENKVITNNIGEIFLLKDGTAKNPLNLNDYHPLSTTNGLLVHIEDGLPTNIVTTTYKPQNMSDFVTHEFPLFFRGMVEKKVYGATRVFAQYFTWVPTILLARNKNKDNLMGVDLTVTQTTGANLLGGFDTLLQLNSEHPPTVELADERAIAYVIDNNDKGFYNVVFTDDSYVWTKIIMPLAYYDIDVKQYNTFEIIVQKGHAPTNSVPITISDEIVRLLYQEIARINDVVAKNETDIDSLEIDVAALEYDLGLLTNRVGQNETDISGLDGRTEDIENELVDVNEELLRLESVKANKSEVENELQMLEDDKLSKSGGTMTGEINMGNNKIKNIDRLELTGDGVIRSYYSGQSTVFLIDGRIGALNGNGYLEFDDKTFRLYKNQRITFLGEPTQSHNAATKNYVDNFREATPSLKGFMSATDKTKLDELWEIFDNGEDEDFVDTIKEILEIFSQYPEGVDILEKFSEKADKDAVYDKNAADNKFVEKVDGYDLSKNNYTDVDKNKVGLIKNDGDGTKYFADDGTYKTVVGGGGYGTMTQLDIDNGDVTPKVVTGELLKEIKIDGGIF